MKKIISKIKNSLEEKDILEIRKKNLCTFSGGQDSTLTLVSFLHFQNIFNFEFEIIYCHHFIQLKNFFCYWQIVRLNYIFQIPISIVLAITNLKNENYARSWRKTTFERIYHLNQCSNILLGHTASDRLETAIYNFNRGTSSQGLINFTAISTAKNQSILIFFTSRLLNRKYKLESNFHVAVLKKNLCFFNFTKIKKQRFSLFWPIKIKVFYEIQPRLSLMDIKEKLKLKSTKNFEFQQIPKQASLRIQLYETYDLFLFSSRFRIIKKLLKWKFNLSFSLVYSFHSKKIKFSRFLVRPLSNLHRNDVGKICKIFKLPIINDNTNDLTEISRNKIRHQFFPLVRYFFSPKVDFFTSRFLNILMLEQNYINLVIDNILKILINQLTSEFKKSLKNFPANKKILASTLPNYKKSQIRQFFKTLSIPLQRVCIRKIFIYYTNTQLNYTQIEFLRLLIQKI
jgi:tRNA(Ile)-lysidine synthase TilS/MesJ